MAGGGRGRLGSGLFLLGGCGCGSRRVGLLGVVLIGGRGPVWFEFFWEGKGWGVCVTARIKKKKN